MRPDHGDEVYLLIKRMPQTEKRYFKLFSPNSNKGKDYIELFDLYDKMKVYDHDSFLKKIKAKGWGKNWMNKRDFLKGRIMVAMQAYHREKSLERNIHNHLEYFDYLYKMGSYQWAGNELKKAKKLAQESNELTYLLRINELERRLFRERKQSKKYGLDLRGLVEEQDQLLKQLNSYYSLLHQYDYIFQHFRQDKMGEVLLEWSENFEEIGAPTGDDDLDGFKVWKVYLMTKAMIAYSEKAWKVNHQCYDDLIRLYKKHKRTDGEYQVEYFKVQSNYLESLRLIDVYGKDFEAVLAEMKTALGSKIPNPDFEGELWQCWLQNQIVFLFNEQLWEEAKAIIPLADDILLKWGHKINLSRKLTIKMNLALLCFALERWEETEKRILEIFTNKSFQIRPGFIKLSKLLLVVVSYELAKSGTKEGDDYFESKFRTALRDNPTPFFRAILNKVKKTHNATHSNRQDLFKELAEFIVEDWHGNPKSGFKGGAAELYYWASSRTKTNYRIMDAMRDLQWPPADPESDATLS